MSLKLGQCQGGDIISCGVKKIK